MNCHQARKNLPAYLDDELDGIGRQRLESHLRGCDTCQRELAQAREFDEYLRASSPTRVPPDFLPRVVARMRAEANAPVPSREAAAQGWAWPSLIARLFGLLRAPALAATAAVVLLAMICGYQFGRMATTQFNRFAQPQQARASEWLELVPREFASAQPPRGAKATSNDLAMQPSAGGRK